MKKILLLIAITTLLSCDSDSDGGDLSQGIGPWNLINIKGGVNNIDTDIDRGQITWVFNDLTNKVTVTNNIGGIPTGISDGEHDFRLERSGNDDFLIIDNDEYGALTIGTSRLTIDQTITSTGNAPDEYILLFAR